jgi:hypothetical protein
MTFAERVDVSAGRDAAGDRTGGDGLRANEGTIAGCSAVSVSFSRAGSRGAATDVATGGVASGGFGIGFCAVVGGGDAGVGGDGRAGALDGATGAGVDAVAVSVFSDAGVGVDRTVCTGIATLGVAVGGGVVAIGVPALGGGSDLCVARGSGCTRGVCSVVVARAFAATAESAGCVAGGIGSASRVGAAMGGGRTGAAAGCATSDARSAAAGTCAATGAVAATFEDSRAAAIFGSSMAGEGRSRAGVACAAGGKSLALGIGTAAVGGSDGAGRSANVASVAGASATVSGNGSVFRAMRVRGVVSVVAVGGFGAARLGFATASSVAAGFAVARRAGGFGAAGVSPGVGTATSVAGDFRLRGVFGRSVSSMRQV